MGGHRHLGGRDVALDAVFQFGELRLGIEQGAEALVGPERRLGGVVGAAEEALEVGLARAAAAPVVVDHVHGVEVGGQLDAEAQVGEDAAGQPLGLPLLRPRQGAHGADAAALRGRAVLALPEPDSRVAPGEQRPPRGKGLRVAAAFGHRAVGMVGHLVHEIGHPRLEALLEVAGRHARVGAADDDRVLHLRADDRRREPDQLDVLSGVRLPRLPEGARVVRLVPDLVVADAVAVSSGDGAGVAQPGGPGRVVEEGHPADGRHVGRIGRVEPIAVADAEPRLDADPPQTVHDGIEPGEVVGAFRRLGPRPAGLDPRPLHPELCQVLVGALGLE